MSAAPFKVKAVYEYKSAEPDDLNFPNGQIITVTVEEDDDWYTGNYVDTSGSTKEGLFPKNFVEKYEPAIPSRPKRVQAKVDAPAEAPLPVAAAQKTENPALSSRPVEASREAESLPIPVASPPAQHDVHNPPPATGQSVAAAKPAGGKAPPPVAEKPSSNSFRDRIAAFNKTGAPPPTPFKPSTQNTSSPFINKRYIAPPPIKDAYVHPPREQPPQKVFNRGDDPDIAREEPTTASGRAAEVPTANEEDDDAPKPMTLKERMALLQKEQLERTQRHAEGVQKKEKPKRPKKPRVDSSENINAVRPSLDAPIERVQSNETLGKGSVEFADDEAGPLRGNSKTSQDRNAIASPPPPSRELVSDTNDADDSGAGDTEDAQETSTEEERPKSKHGAADHVLGAFTEEPESTTNHRDAEAADEDEEEEADDTDEDPEVKKRRDIRDRMAKLSGGMGTMGIQFGLPGGMAGATSAKSGRVSAERTRQQSGQQKQQEEVSGAPPVPGMPMPGMAMPGMTKALPPPANESSDEDEPTQPTPRDTNSRNLSDGEEEYPTRKSTGDRTAPPIPQNRGPPPLPPNDTRRPPSSGERPVPTRADSKDFASAPPPPSRPTRPTPEEHTDLARPQSKGGPPALPPAPPRRPTEPSRLDTSPPQSPSAENKRFSRGPPPVPMSPTFASPQSRAPPPPPPGQAPSRRSTNDSRMSSSRHPAQGHSEEETDGNEADIDTDVGRTETHKAALTAHNRDSSLDEDTLTDEVSSPTSPPARIVPPVPNASAPRDGPPPLPPQGAHQRKPSEGPRSAPPPVPPPKEDVDDDEYDPFKYNQPVNSPPSRPTYAPVLASPMEEREQDNMYDPTPTATRTFQHPTEWSPTAPPSSAAPLMSGGIGQGPMQESRTSMQGSRPSIQGGRPSTHNDRGSLEQSRDHTIMATDIDLGQNTMWWTKPNTPPPSLKSRDVLYEIESSTSTNRSGKGTTRSEIYALYPDYSQTTINCTFDPSDPQHATLEQKHDRPPPQPRRDQLEAASSQFGSVIASSAAGKLNTTVGDGTSQSFILELLKPLSTQALMPIGTRSFGAAVYANMANTSIQVTDEIRPGDIVTFRTAKFNGKHGPMHQKYSAEAGMSGKEHVAVVAEWDGTKKKIKVWEQGREKEGKRGKVREESWRMGDLRSGDVRVWRVMSRAWVGWDAGK